jgi:hypothetical protein
MLSEDFDKLVWNKYPKCKPKSFTFLLCYAEEFGFYLARYVPLKVGDPYWENIDGREIKDPDYFTMLSSGVLHDDSSRYKE